MGTDKCDHLLYSMLYSPESYETGSVQPTYRPERLDSEVVCNELGTQEIDDGGHWARAVRKPRHAITSHQTIRSAQRSPRALPS
jgi:hypothetical protein